MEMAKGIPADMLDLLSGDDGYGQEWQEVAERNTISAPVTQPNSGEKREKTAAAKEKTRAKQIKYNKESRKRKKAIQKAEWMTSIFPFVCVHYLTLVNSKNKFMF